MFSNGPGPSFGELMAFGSVELSDCTRLEPASWDIVLAYVFGLSPPFLCRVRAEAFSLAGSSF